jgi:hypothetical protein
MLAAHIVILRGACLHMCWQHNESGECRCPTGADKATWPRLLLLAPSQAAPQPQSNSSSHSSTNSDTTSCRGSSSSSSR